MSFSIEQKLKDCQQDCINLEKKELILRKAIRLLITSSLGLSDRFDELLIQLKGQIKEEALTDSFNDNVEKIEQVLKEKIESLKKEAPEKKYDDLLVTLKKYSDITHSDNLYQSVQKIKLDGNDSEIIKSFNLLLITAYGYIEKKLKEFKLTEGDINLNKQSKKIFSVLEQTEELKEEKSKIEDILSRPIRTNQIESVVEDLSEIVTNSILKERESYQDFLKSLMDKFNNIGLNITESLSSEDDIINSIENVKDLIQLSVNNITISLEQDDDFKNTTPKLETYLDKISKAIIDHHQIEIKHIKENQQRMLKMQEEINELKTEAGILKNNLFQVTEKVNTDNLTMLSNRNGYDQYRKKIESEGKLKNIKYIIAVVDIDDFKKVNDTYGHLVGDTVIKQVAKTFKECLSKKDFIARFGGEEFVVIFEGLTLEEAAKHANNIRDKIHNNEISITEKTKTSISVSIGLAEINLNTGVIFAMNEADHQLLKAKSDGKNKICY